MSRRGKYFLLTLISIFSFLFFMQLWKNGHILEAIIRTFDNTNFLRRLDKIHSRQNHEISDAKLISFSSHVTRHQKCSNKPQKSIFYIKIHKTGSTTLRSTLLLYGMKHNLTICMDATDLWGVNWPYQIDEIKLTKLRSEKCDLVAEELIYNQEIVRRLMGEDVFTVTSVRHPVQHFLSLFKYSGIQKAVEKLVKQPVDEWESMRIFLKNPSLVQNVYATFTEDEVRDRLQINMVRSNLQLYSLGAKSNDLDEIERLTDKLDFIVIAEKFDESMVMLKEKLCASLTDVVYRRQNVRRTNKEAVKIPSDVKEAILAFNAGDLLLYGIAQRRLYNDIVGHENFSESLKRYKTELEEYEKRCEAEEGMNNALRSSCPPISSGQTGAFVESVRNHQREKLMKKLQREYLSS